MSKARLTAVFAEAFRATDVTGTLHYLRHTFATTMLVHRMHLPKYPAQPHLGAPQSDAVPAGQARWPNRSRYQ